MYNDPAATPGPEAGPSAGASTGPGSGLAASIYAPGPAPPGPAPPGSATAPSTAPASASPAHRKFKHPRVSNLKIDKITTLTGKENYQSWADQLTMNFIAVGLFEVVMNGAKARNGDSYEEWDAYNKIVSEVIVILVQVISKPIMTIIGRIQDPHLIWIHLRTQYYSDTSYSFVQKLHTLFSLSSLYDANKPISEFIETFENEWAALEQLATSTSTASSGASSYRRRFNAFLSCDEAKRNILLSSLCHGALTYDSALVTTMSLAPGE